MQENMENEYREFDFASYLKSKVSNSFYPKHYMTLLVSQSDHILVEELLGEFSIALSSLVSKSIKLEIISNQDFLRDKFTQNVQVVVLNVYQQEILILLPAGVLQKILGTSDAIQNSGCHADSESEILRLNRLIANLEISKRHSISVTKYQSVTEEMLTLAEQKQFLSLQLLVHVEGEAIECSILVSPKLSRRMEVYNNASSMISKEYIWQRHAKHNWKVNLNLLLKSSFALANLTPGAEVKVSELCEPSTIYACMLPAERIVKPSRVLSNLSSIKLNLISKIVPGHFAVNMNTEISSNH